MTLDGEFKDFPIPYKGPVSGRTPGVSPPARTATSGSPCRARSKIGRMTMAGEITEWALADDKAGPADITLGPDGNVWFTEIYAGKLGRITPDGQITEFPTGGEKSSPKGITVGPDGNIWYTDLGQNRIGRMTPRGEVKDFGLAGATARSRASPPGPTATSGSPRPTPIRSPASRCRARRPKARSRRNQPVRTPSPTRVTESPLRRIVARAALSSKLVSRTVRIGLATVSMT